MQRHGTVNADGFGVGWYADGDPVPARYRRAVPIWADPSLPDLARVTRSARGARRGARRHRRAPPLGEAAAAPFASGPWLFSHNGRAGGLAGVRGGGWPAVAAATLLALEAMMDSAFLWALVLERLRAGAATGRRARRDDRRRRGGRRDRAVQLPAHRRAVDRRDTARGHAVVPASRTAAWSSPPSRATTNPAGPRCPTGSVLTRRHRSSACRDRRMRPHRSDRPHRTSATKGS